MYVRKQQIELRKVLVMLAILLILVVAFIAGIFYGSASGILIVRESDALRGAGNNSNILLIEYSDYECPYCARFHPVAQSLAESGEVQWVYRHLPLTNIHLTAMEGALIAECARTERGDGAFWEYTDTVFVGSERSVAFYRTIGRQVGLTDEQMDGCLTDGSDASSIVRLHTEDAKALGVNGTPGSFLVNTKNGAFRSVPGALPLDSDDGGVSMRGLIREIQESHDLVQR